MKCGLQRKYLLVLWEAGASFSAFVLDAVLPAPLRRGALEAPGGQLDSSRDMLTLLKQGVGAPLRVNRMGRDIPSAVDFAKDASG